MIYTRLILLQSTLFWIPQRIYWYLDRPLVASFQSKKYQFRAKLTNFSAKKGFRDFKFSLFTENQLQFLKIICSSLYHPPVVVFVKKYCIRRKNRVVLLLIELITYSLRSFFSRPQPKQTGTKWSSWVIEYDKRKKNSKLKLRGARSENVKKNWKKIDFFFKMQWN